MFPLNWNIPFIKKNGSRTTLGAITGDIAGIEDDIAGIKEDVIDLNDKADGILDNIMENGAVNYAPNSVTSQTKNNVEFTVNDDGSFIADGTASGDIFKTSVSADVAAIIITLPAGTYKYQLSDTTISGVTAIIKNAATATDIARSTNNSLEFTLTQETAIYVDWKIASGTQLTNQKMYALVTLASYTGPYVPYAKTNKELTDDLANMGLVSADPNKTTFNITYQGGKSGDMALVITSVGIGSLNYYASAWHWGGFVIASGTTITESDNSANGLTLTASGNIGLFLLPLNTEGDKWAITTN